MIFAAEDLAARLGRDAEFAGSAEGTAGLSSFAFWDDPADVRPEPGTVVLAAGASESELPAVLERARERGCPAVVARNPTDRLLRQRALIAAGEMALVLVQPSVPWNAVIHAIGELVEGTARSQPRTPVGQMPEGDLFSLAAVLAEQVGGPVIIEDANFQVLSYSSFTGATDRGRDQAILGRRMPAEWLEHLERSGGLDRLRTTSEVVDVPSGPWQARRRLITALRSEAQLLGILWVAEGDDPLPPDAAVRLREAADIAVPHILRHHDNHQAERQWRGQLVRSLLDGRGQLHRHFDELGLPRGAPLAVLGFVPDDDVNVTDDEWDRITDHVALSCAAFSWRAAVSRSGGTVFALLVVPPDSSDEGVLRLGRKIVDRVIPVLRGRLRGATSSVGRGLGMIPSRRRETEDALGAMLEQTRSGGPRFVHYDQIRPIAVLRELGQLIEDRADLRLPGLQALAEADTRRGSAFVLTLRTYLQARSNASEAARRLNLHVTSLRYRLARIRELSGLDLDDPWVSLLCELLLVVGAAPVRGEEPGAATRFAGPPTGPPGPAHSPSAGITGRRR
jgi:hypothetical protein